MQSSLRAGARRIGGWSRVLAGSDTAKSISNRRSPGYQLQLQLLHETAKNAEYHENVVAGARLVRWMGRKGRRQGGLFAGGCGRTRICVLRCLMQGIRLGLARCWALL